ncbi:hypothetical protein [Butyrivibrio sp. NC2002]|uniref:hypothetical protein n=1 Tax=Butyrivibrio sp. NC2002 TaxID=1410610 RepID=UPI00068EA660|nr:hypothetical protein [Butyrivibrio sp. NC2002]
MDSKSFKLSILAIITTCVLVGVVVYAANRDKIHALIGADDFADTDDSVYETTEEISSEYGEQIGDDLKGFLTADDFFDKSEQRPSVVVVVDNVPVPANAEEQEEDTTDLIDKPADESADLESDDQDEAADEEDSAEPEDEQDLEETQDQDKQKESETDKVTPEEGTSNDALNEATRPGTDRPYDVKPEDASKEASN